MPKAPGSPPSEMPFLDHLEELRWRLLWSILAVVIAVVGAFFMLWHLDVLLILQQPIMPYLQGRKLVFTNPGDPLRIILSASFAMGMVLALPVILWQLWAFVAPALYRAEKRVAVGVLLGGAFLFLCGASLSYFFVLPISLKFLLTGIQSDALEPMITASEYFGFALNMTLSFGVCFELPIIVLALAALGVVTPEFLVKFRRHAMVLCVVVGAVLSPGDLIWATMAMAIPLYVLYEVSIVLAVIVERRRRKREAAAAAEAAADAAA